MIIRFEDFRKLINILMDINNIFNIYDLLSTEYINILSNESIYESNTNTPFINLLDIYILHKVKE